MAANDNENPIAAAAISLVKTEKDSWETATAFVTDRVAFQMRNLIRQLRKNYWGVFDTPKDPVTGRDKIWVPLTESTTEAVVKNIDLDTKDINFRATNDAAIGLTQLARALTKKNLDDMGFGEMLDLLERQLAIDGTVVWKTLETKDEKGKPCLDVRLVDLLNIYIDPVANRISDPDVTFIERAVMSPNDVKQMTGWVNTDNLQPITNLNPYDGDQVYSYMNTGEAPMVEIFERWGKMPKYLITADLADKDVWIDGHIVVSRSGGNAWNYHLIEANPGGKKPYEEAWYTRIHGRWYGKGVAEKVMWLQLWANTIVNIRINRSYVSQLGIFKIKRGAGITPQMISRLASNGAIQVNAMDDIEQFVMQEASQASYKDEENIQAWVARVTSTFETVVGEALPASTPATNAAIQAQNGQSAFVLIKEGIGMFLQRWLKNHAIPIIFKNVTAGEIVEVTGDPNMLKALDEFYVNGMMCAALEAANSQQVFLDPAQIEQERQRALMQLTNSGGTRFVKLLKDLNPTDYGVQVYVTNEEFDKTVMAQNLGQALSLAPEYREQILTNLFDLMGVGPLKPIQPQANRPSQKVNESLNYKDAPDDIRRQIEAQAGMQPSQLTQQAGAAAPIAETQQNNAYAAAAQGQTA